MQHDINGSYYLELSGDDHFTIGMRHGEALCNEIAEAIVRFKQWLEVKLEVDAEQFIEQIATESTYLNTWEQYTPHLVEELRGIAKGAGRRFNEIYAYNLMEEILDSVIERAVGSTAEAAHCTTFAVCGREGRNTILAENMDWATYADGAQTVFRIHYPQSDLKILMYGFAGMIGGIGVNNRSLGVAVNTVLNAGKRTWQEGGMTCTVTPRLLLEQANVDGAVGCLKAMPHSYGNNYMLASPQSAVTVEVSKHDVVVIESTDEKPYVAHTNHALKTDDLIPLGDYFNGRDMATVPSIANTAERLDCAISAIEAGYDRFDVEAATAILDKAPVKIMPGALASGSLTLQSMVVEFGDKVTAHFLAPTQSDQYQRYQF